MQWSLSMMPRLVLSASLFDWGQKHSVASWLIASWRRKSLLYFGFVVLGFVFSQKYQRKWIFTLLFLDQLWRGGRNLRSDFLVSDVMVDEISFVRTWILWFNVIEVNLDMPLRPSQLWVWFFSMQIFLDNLHRKESLTFQESSWVPKDEGNPIGSWGRQAPETSRCSLKRK